MAESTESKKRKEIPAEGKSNTAISDEKLAADPSLQLTSKDYYFDSYSHFGIHEEMLKDETRTNAYMRAILDNPHLFKDKVVLDIGAGTGILSMFAAKAGAARVYAVECSGIAEQCSQIVADNGFADIITVLRGKMEEVVLEHEYVDVIISEWMGYMLLYESMLDTVLWARDRYLRPLTGVILPDKAIMHVCAIEDREYRQEKIDFWDSVYGFNFKCIKCLALAEPLVDHVSHKLVVTNSASILTLDLLSCSKGDLAYSGAFSLKCLRTDYIHALVVYWDCYFTQTLKEIRLSTSPFSRGTHWKQTVFYLKSSIAAHQDEELSGSLSCRPNSSNNRDLDILIRYSFDGALCKVDEEQFYRLR